MTEFAHWLSSRISSDKSPKSRQEKRDHLKTIEYLKHAHRKRGGLTWTSLRISVDNPDSEDSLRISESIIYHVKLFSSVCGALFSWCVQVCVKAPLFMMCPSFATIYSFHFVKGPLLIMCRKTLCIVCRALFSWCVQVLLPYTRFFVWRAPFSWSDKDEW